MIQWKNYVRRYMKLLTKYERIKCAYVSNAEIMSAMLPNICRNANYDNNGKYMREEMTH